MRVRERRDLRSLSLHLPSEHAHLVYLGRVGSLSTLSRKQPGFPFGSVMPYGLDDHANPIFLIAASRRRMTTFD
jgi:putative heme iron utilization protein